MATTTGFVQRLTLLSGLTCAWVGPVPNVAEALFVQLNAADSQATIDFKQSLIGLLLEAQLAGQEVEVGHAEDAAVITSVSTPLSNISTIPLQADAIEITQAVQDLGHSIPLLAGKRTVVRLYLSYHTTPALTVQGTISIRRSPTDLPLLVLSDNVVVLDPALAGNVSAKRQDATRSLNFVLPPSHTAVGPLHLSISTITEVVSGGVLNAGSARQPTVWFHPTPPLRIRVLGMTYSQGTPPVLHAPRAIDYNFLFSWLGRAYPASQVVGSTGVVAATAAVQFESGDINAQLAAIRALDMDAGADARTHYYGLVSDGGFFMRGSAAGIPDTPNPATVASGPTGTSNWGWDFDGSYGDWYGGHELGHTFGRRHPGFCGETQSDLDNYPFANGQLANSGASFFGFDVGDPTYGIPMRALPGLQWHDFMTYCNFQWSSAYTYLGIRRRLAEEDLLNPVAGPAPFAQLTAGGRPDNRFPHGRIPGPQLQGNEGAQVMINVVAQVNLTRKEGKIRFVNPLQHGLLSPPVTDEAVTIRVRNAAGEELQQHPVAVQIDSELHPADDLRGIVTAVLPVSAEARTIELVLDGELVVDTFPVGGARPTARSSTDAAMTGQAAPAYFAQVSTDNGQTWLTAAIGLQEPVFTLDQSQYPAGAEVLVRVVATNGLTNAVISQEPVRIKPD
jgi:hypothetical protein